MTLRRPLPPTFPALMKVGCGPMVGFGSYLGHSEGWKLPKHHARALLGDPNPNLVNRVWRLVVKGQRNGLCPLCLPFLPLLITVKDIHDVTQGGLAMRGAGKLGQSKKSHETSQEC